MSAADATRLLEELIYELLEAHSDIVALVDGPSAQAWDAHLDYLRVLQRRVRGILAEATGAMGVSSD
jgi:hypothetical protein